MSLACFRRSSLYLYRRHDQHLMLIVPTVQIQAGRCDEGCECSALLVTSVRRPQKWWRAPAVNVSSTCLRPESTSGSAVPWEVDFGLLGCRKIFLRLGCLMARWIANAVTFPTLYCMSANSNALGNGEGGSKMGTYGSRMGP